MNDAKTIIMGVVIPVVCVAASQVALDLWYKKRFKKMVNTKLQEVVKNR